MGIVIIYAAVIVNPTSTCNRLLKEVTMKKPVNFYKDIVTGLLFTAGVFGFMSGEFILSTVLFGSASLTSNLDLKGAVRA